MREKLENSIKSYEYAKNEFEQNSGKFPNEILIKKIKELDSLKKECLIEFHHLTKEYNSLDNCLSLINHPNLINFLKSYLKS